MGVVLLCVAILAASTATTGFAVLGVFAWVVAKDAVAGLTGVRARIKLSRGQVGAVAILAVAALGALVFIQSNWRHIDNVLTSMVLEKRQSSSFASRSGVDVMAVDIVIQTGGIGIGLGSHKPNNLAMTLLSNTGIAGFLVFGFFLLELLRPRLGESSDVDVRPYRWMIAGLISVNLISNPNLHPIILWISFALIIGALTAERKLAGNRCPVSTWRSPVVSAAGVPSSFSTRWTEVRP
jgi:hypothetical protein